MSSSSANKVQNQIQPFLQSLYQDANIQVTRLDTLPSTPHTGHIITTSTSTYYILKTAPLRSARLLRYETASPADEASILDRLSRHRSMPIPNYLFASHSTDNVLHSPFLLRSYIPGIPLSSISHRLTTYDREQIDKAIGGYIRTAISNSASQFGTLARIANGTGYATWREAFHSLFEAALRDSEDAVLTLPYQSIRYWVGANLHWLDVVRDPKLVPLRAGLAETVLIDEARKTVAGIVSWGDVLWGDAVMGKVFEEAGRAFWSGFGGRQILEFGDGGDELRSHIYTVYRCIVAIVRHSCRPRLGVDESSIRRKLNWALNQLAKQ